jgi:hypothetical protein
MQSNLSNAFKPYKIKILIIVELKTFILTHDIN